MERTSIKGYRGFSWRECRELTPAFLLWHLRDIVLRALDHRSLWNSGSDILSAFSFFFFKQIPQRVYKDVVEGSSVISSDLSRRLYPIDSSLILVSQTDSRLVRSVRNVLRSWAQLGDFP